MRDMYIRNYVSGVHLRLSLDALWHHLSWPPPAEAALVMTDWGPFHLTGTNAPFVVTFIRTVDRALHHSSNVWRQLAEDLANAKFALKHLEPGAVLQTGDRASKYEIEAFLGAVVGVTELNLIGDKARNRLGQSHGLGDELKASIRQEADSFKAMGVTRKWHQIRNSAYHLNPEMHDWGFTATIQSDGNKYRVGLLGVHYVEGAPADLVEAFAETYAAFVGFVERVRSLLLGFSCRAIAIPTHNTYRWSMDSLGNMLVGFGPNGFEFKHFPETAADFIGPPHPPSG